MGHIGTGPVRMHGLIDAIRAIKLVMASPKTRRKDQPMRLASYRLDGEDTFVANLAALEAVEKSNALA